MPVLVSDPDEEELEDCCLPFVQSEADATLDVEVVITSFGAWSTDMVISASMLDITGSALLPAGIAALSAPFTASRMASSSSLARRRMMGGAGWNTDKNAAMSAGVRSASEKM